MDSIPGFALEVVPGKKGYQAGLRHRSQSLSLCPTASLCSAVRTRQPPWSWVPQRPCLRCKRGPQTLSLLINPRSLPSKGQRLIWPKGGQNSVRKKPGSRATFQDITQDLVQVRSHSVCPWAGPRAHLTETGSGHGPELMAGTKATLASVLKGLRCEPGRGPVQRWPLRWYGCPHWGGHAQLG